MSGVQAVTLCDNLGRFSFEPAVVGKLIFDSSAEEARVQEMDALKLLCAAPDDGLIEIEPIGAGEIDALQILAGFPDVAHKVEWVQGVEVSEVVQKFGGR